MSNDSQRGYIFGILQRGAYPVAPAKAGRRLPSPRQGALERSDTVSQALAGAADPDESFSPVECNSSQQSLSKTEQVVLPATGHSQPHSPTTATDASPEKPKATATRAPSFPQSDRSQPDSTPVASSYDPVAPSAAVTPGEPFSAANLNGIPQSPNQTNQVVRSRTDQVVHLQTRQSQPRSTAAHPTASPEKPKSMSTRAGGFSQPDSKPLVSSSEQAKPSATASLSESSSITGLNKTAPGLNQTSQVAGLQTTKSQPRSQTDTAADAQPEQSAAEATRAGSFSQPDDKLSDSCSQTVSAREPGAEFLPVTDPTVRDRFAAFTNRHAASKRITLPVTEGESLTRVEAIPATTLFSQSRLPRLIVIDEGGKTIVSQNSSSVTKEETGPVVREESGKVFDSQPFLKPLAEPSDAERGLSSTSLLSGQPPTQAYMPALPAQGSRVVIEKASDTRAALNAIGTINERTSANGEVSSEPQAAISLQADLSDSIESVRSLPPPEVLPVENSRSPGSAVPNRSPQPETSRRMLARVLEESEETSVADFRAQPSDSNVTPVPGRAEAWPTSLPEQTEEPFSQRPFGRHQPRGEPAAKLTINRLDVQIVNQSPMPVDPLPPAQPPPPVDLSPDPWEKLERHQLGHLDLMF